MRTLLAAALALLCALPARAAGPADEGLSRLEAKEASLKADLGRSRTLLEGARSGRSARDPKVAAENREATGRLENAVADTRAALASVRASLRKLRELAGLLAELKRRPKAVFGVAWERGGLEVVTKEGRRPLKAGETLEGGGLIHAGDAPASIILPDGARFALAPHAVLDTRTWTLVSGEVYYEGVLERGLAELKGRVRKKFEVRTGGGTCSVRGTRFLLSDTLVLFDGEVEFSTGTAGGEAPAASPLAPGAVAVTGPGESRDLSVGGALVVRLGPGSRLEAAKSGKPMAFLRAGAAELFARGSGVKVLVPNGAAEAEAADWSLRVTPSGAAEFTPRAGTVVLKADEKRLDERALEAWWDAPYRREGDED